MIQQYFLQFNYNQINQMKPGWNQTVQTKNESSKHCDLTPFKTTKGQGSLLSKIGSLSHELFLFSDIDLSTCRIKIYQKRFSHEFNQPTPGNWI